VSDEQPLAEERSPGRLVLPSLVISYFATSPAGILTGLLLIDIGLTFEVSVGVTGQISTLSYVVAVIFALFMGALSVRFSHKSLLLIGLLFLNISAIGCPLASNFNLMLISYSLNGLALAMVTPMTITLIGEHFPLEKRANAVGWLVAGGSLAYVIGAPVISFIAGIGGWRLAFFAFVLPVSLASLLLAFIGLPPTSSSHQPTSSEGTYLGGFKGVLSNRSATACLSGNVLRMAAFMAVLIYGVSFFRQRFLVSRGFASIIIIGAALCYTLGSLVSGRFIGRVGRKPLTVLTALLAGVFTISFTYVPNLWLSLALNFLGAWFFGMVASASSSLTLEQVPRFRGTMMSLNSAAQSLGSALGTAIGGSMLILFGYEVLASALGALGVVAAVVFHLLTTDPTRKRDEGEVH